jgi:hypothetical protein
MIAVPVAGIRDRDPLRSWTNNALGQRRRPSTTPTTTVARRTGRLIDYRAAAFRVK